ncbi:hypothetical protein T07_4294 [Trichinella nelsoni]|uniref:Uncharacterized protein n=1 Tax=Trichinella nelsoni TaxID=6336 RepID=A0A0V0RD80_9BILA|nr:hypothetical protein T07_4294 [Trichinella nelsoni]
MSYTYNWHTIACLCLKGRRLRFRPRYVDDRSTHGGSRTISPQRRSPSSLKRGCLMAESYQRLAALFSLSQE